MQQTPSQSVHQKLMMLDFVLGLRPRRLTRRSVANRALGAAQFVTPPPTLSCGLQSGEWSKEAWKATALPAADASRSVRSQQLAQTSQSRGRAIVQQAGGADAGPKAQAAVAAADRMGSALITATRPTLAPSSAIAACPSRLPLRANAATLRLWNMSNISEATPADAVRASPGPSAMDHRPNSAASILHIQVMISIDAQSASATAVAWETSQEQRKDGAHPLAIRRSVQGCLKHLRPPRSEEWTTRTFTARHQDYQRRPPLCGRAIRNGSHRPAIHPL
mmetsp:Transcript_20205/g.47132  ORF Transcript_20205/g.47132 Transcript_20205/m.47132 type:complete len:278 (-) Transcript_20205:212-1045(-)